MTVARDERIKWKRDGVPMEQRRPLLLEALNRIYHPAPDAATLAETNLVSAIAAGSVVDRDKD